MSVGESRVRLGRASGLGDTATPDRQASTQQRGKGGEENSNLVTTWRTCVSTLAPSRRVWVYPYEESATQQEFHSGGANVTQGVPARFLEPAGRQDWGR